MPGKVQELRIGPFSGGINTFSDKSAIADDEMTDCVNFDIDLDGSLKSRPPWSLLYGRDLTELADVDSAYDIMLGTYVYNGVRLVVYYSSGISDSLPPVVQVLSIDGDVATPVGVFTFPTAIYKVSTSVRYEDSIYCIPSPDSGAATGLIIDLTTMEAVTQTNMRKGNRAVVYKDSLYVGGGNTDNKSRLYFSALADFTNWPDTNFFDINPGDGTTLQDFCLYQDNLVIAKDSYTYVLSYDTTPEQAVVRNINTDIGVKGPFCLATYENSVFFLQYNTVYEMVNYDFTRVSVKLPFELDETIDTGTYDLFTVGWKFPIFLSVVGDRLVVRFFNRLYIYHLRIRAWTRWATNDVSVRYLGPIFEVNRTNTTDTQGYRTYVACQALQNVIDPSGSGATPPKIFTKIYQFKDTYESTGTENGAIDPLIYPPSTINCSATTKVFDVGLSYRFKRLMHWGADVITANGVTGTLFPIAMSYRAKWSELRNYTWAELQTWGYPLVTIPSFTQVAAVTNRVDRRFIRFPKSLRFRLLQFQIEFTTTGNTSDGPARLYSLTAFIGAKQLVPEAVN